MFLLGITPPYPRKPHFSQLGCVEFFETPVTPTFHTLPINFYTHKLFLKIVFFQHRHFASSPKDLLKSITVLVLKVMLISLVSVKLYKDGRNPMGH